MPWSVDGYDCESDLIAESTGLAGLIDECEIVAALGNPEDARYAAWPMTPELAWLVSSKTEITFRPDREYFVEYTEPLRRRNSGR